VGPEQLARLEKQLEAQKGYAAFIQKKTDEARLVFVEMMPKDTVVPSFTNSQQVAQVAKVPVGGKGLASSNQCVQVAKGTAVGKESSSSNHVAQVVKEPAKGNELVRGVAKTGEKISLGKQKELQNFKMEKGDSLILAVWSTSGGKELCGDFYPITVTQLESKKALCWTSRANQDIGGFSLKGISKGTKFPLIEKAVDAKPKEGKSRTYTVEKTGIFLWQPKRSATWQFSSSIAEQAPAVVVKVNQAGTYSLSGEFLIWRSPTGSSEWMVFIAKLN
jgi:hypothetical protein